MSQEAEEEDEALQDEGEDDPLANLLSLKLKKPSHWNWELSTSRSCSQIALPRILLYDHTGNLLVDADGQEEQTYTSRQPQRRRKRSATSNLSLERNFHGLHIAEATPSATPTPTPTATPSSSRESGRRKTHGSCIDFSTHELPNWEPSSVSSRRSSSLRGVRFQEAEDLLVYPTPPSTSTLNSSSSGPREKRRYREQLATRHVGGRNSTRSQLIADHGIERDGRRESEREGALGQQPSASETAPQYKLSSENIALFLFASP